MPILAHKLDYAIVDGLSSYQYLKWPKYNTITSLDFLERIVNLKNILYARIAVSIDDKENLKAINRAIEEIRFEGIYRQISLKHFGFINY